MKKTILLVATLLITSVATQAQVNLGKIKDKAKEKVDDKKDDATNAADPYYAFMEKGDKAFAEKKWQDAKDNYTKAKAANGSDYVKSQVQSQIDKCDDNLKSCAKKTEKIDKLYGEKNFVELITFYERGDSDNSNFESNCLCDDKMKSKIDDSRKQAGQQKEDSETKAMADAEAMLSKMENMKYQCDNLEPDNGVSSATHSKYMKKLVFSKTEIVKGSENESSFASTFNVTDNIYSRAYLEKSIGTEAKSIGDCYSSSNFIRFTFNDGSFKMPEWLGESNKSSGAESNWTTWQPALSPSGSDLSGDLGGIKNYVRIVRNLPAGTYKVKMEIVYDIPEDEKPAGSRYAENCRLFTTKFGKEKVLATGEFTLVVTEEGKKALYKKVCPMYKDIITDYNRPAFTLEPKAATLVKETKGIDWNKFTLLKIVCGTNWEYSKNVYGIITNRWTAGHVYLLNKEDNFIYYSDCSFTQDNISSGGSSYGPTYAFVEEQNIEFTRHQDSFCKECIGK